MKQENEKIKRSIKVYPIFTAFTGDLIFFVPIDTLFLTLVKGLSASQITAMTMISLLICIIFQNVILKIVKKIGNVKSIRLGIGLILISALFLTFGKNFVVILMYNFISEIGFMLLNMNKILLKNNLKSLNKEDEYYEIRNKSKIIYALITMITALVTGYLFNVNNYLPMYLSLIVYLLMLFLSVMFYESEQVSEEKAKTDQKKSKIKISSTIFLVIISNAVFYSIIKMGQNNSKIFMQYDFQKFLSIEMVTYYITAIVFISRIARLVGNIIFGKVYAKIKHKMSIILTICLSMAFALLILGHLLNVGFIYKVIIMSLGFFLILATRDSFQVYIEDVALDITPKEEQQKILIYIEVYRKILTLILSASFTLILMRYELIVIEIILLILSLIEVFINKKLCDRLNSK